MKKIGILTHYQVHNHGAILQMHGLFNTLKKLGAEPCVLTYKKDFSFISDSLADKYNISLKSLPYYLGYLLKKGLKKTFFNFKKHRTLGKFKKENYRFTPLFQSNMDYVAIGSDEVFSLEAGVNIMMYGHTVPCRNIFSYAASFGQTGIEDIKAKNCLSLIQSGLKNFKALCVRDQASADTVKALCGINPEINFDPVLLYGFEEELKKVSYKIPQGRYLVVYAYDNNMNKPEEVSAIQYYAKQNSLKVISAGYYHKWADINLNLTPLELLKVIKHANCVITDTFHGTVMSALLNVPFVSFVRPINVNKMTYLLESLGLNDRKMTDFNQMPALLQTIIDWQKVNDRIKVLREKGLTYLKGVLDE